MLNVSSDRKTVPSISEVVFNILLQNAHNNINSVNKTWVLLSFILSLSYMWGGRITVILIVEWHFPTYISPGSQNMNIYYKIRKFGEIQTNKRCLNCKAQRDVNTWMKLWLSKRTKLLTTDACDPLGLLQDSCSADTR